LNAGETGELGNRFSSFLEPREETEVEGGEASLRSNSSAGGMELARNRWQRLNGRKRRRAFGESVRSHSKDRIATDFCSASNRLELATVEFSIKPRFATAEFEFTFSHLPKALAQFSHSVDLFHSCLTAIVIPTWRLETFGRVTDKGETQQIRQDLV
jgi:hypothetical protein